MIFFLWAVALSASSGTLMEILAFYHADEHELTSSQRVLLALQIVVSMSLAGFAWRFIVWGW